MIFCSYYCIMARLFFFLLSFPCIVIQFMHTASFRMFPSKPEYTFIPFCLHSHVFFMPYLFPLICRHFSECHVMMSNAFYRIDECKKVKQKENASFLDNLICALFLLRTTTSATTTSTTSTATTTATLESTLLLEGFLHDFTSFHYTQNTI